MSTEANNFNSLGLNETLVRAVHEKGYTTPTPIQLQAIPAILNGRDLMAAAQTGTGKTAGFTLPLLQRLTANKAHPKSNHTRALILTPTRELAAQVHDSVVDYGKHAGLRSTVIFGGVKINPQMMALRRGVDLLVATPGRLMDLYQQNAIQFNDVEILVLDEADRMLDMGFIRDIKKILSLLPKQRQNLLFSATFSPDIRGLAKSLLNNPLEIDVAPRNAPTELVEHKVFTVDKASKARLLSHLIQTQSWFQVLVFCRTKHGANKLVKQLDQDGIRSTAIHGNKSQAQRTKALDDFKKSKVQILVATDIAARGIDINQLPHVVNFDLPDSPEDYVHRIGRTGRAGATGEAISLVSADEFKQLRDIERMIKRELPRTVIEGFAPVHAVPNSSVSPGARANAPAPRSSRSFGPRRGSSGGGKSSGGLGSGLRSSSGSATKKPFPGWGR